MPREQFLYNGTQQICDLLDEAGRRAGVSRGQAFEDFLACSNGGRNNFPVSAGVRGDLVPR